MAKLGGYKMVDLHDISVSTTATTISGVFNAIKDSYRKPLMLVNIKISTAKMQDAYISPLLSSGDYVFDLYGYTWTITEADSVTLTAIE